MLNYSAVIDYVFLIVIYTRNATCTAEVTYAWMRKYFQRSFKKLAKLRKIFSILGFVISGAGESASDLFQGNNSQFPWGK